MKNILLVEDDETIALGVQYSLQSEGFTVKSVINCKEALLIIENRKIDLVLLDINLPDGDGYNLCQQIKKMTSIPVIFLTVCDEEANIVMGLDMGADDYLTKPFRIKELVARIKAVLRRNENSSQQVHFFQYKHIQINTLEGKVYYDHDEILLTAIEYRLLITLFSNQGKTLSREQILNKIWDINGEFINDNTLTVNVKRLREKIEKHPQTPEVIQTVRGLGYRLGE
ncbi:MAG: response regulator transcription factor [Eubacteriaceae bacterium]